MLFGHFLGKRQLNFGLGKLIVEA